MMKTDILEDGGNELKALLCWLWQSLHWLKNLSHCIIQLSACFQALNSNPWLYHTWIDYCTVTLCMTVLSLSIFELYSKFFFLFLSSKMTELQPSFVLMPLFSVVILIPFILYYLFILIVIYFFSCVQHFDH